MTYTKKKKTYTKAGKEKMAKERAEKVSKLTGMINVGIESILDSENFKNLLKSMSVFHQYSANNQLLIFMQRPDATRVAGFQTWKKVNRFVKKGEKGIQILRPVTFKKTEEVNEQGVVSPRHNPKKEGEPTLEMDVTYLGGFTTTTVFDISQTDGEDLPKLDYDFNGAENVENFDKLFNAISDLTTFSVFKETPETDNVLASGAEGYARYADNRIVINADLQQEGQLKVLIHEVAHSLLHEGSKKSKTAKEFDAESIAYVVSNYLGIDTNENSFNYLSMYVGNKDRLKKLEYNLKVIQKTSHDMIEKLEIAFENKEKEEQRHA
ncbi:MAG: ssDNA-binding domain-containing protein [Streptococcaceae bacterium]|jgi:hypothetical protein|nr:ssDNA-binding domain-containing protein [Streptococcaceae bacterium]